MVAPPGQTPRAHGRPRRLSTGVSDAARREPARASERPLCSQTLGPGHSPALPSPVAGASGDRETKSFAFWDIDFKLVTKKRLRKTFDTPSCFRGLEGKACSGEGSDVSCPSWGRRCHTGAWRPAAPAPASPAVQHECSCPVSPLVLSSLSITISLPRSKGLSPASLLSPEGHTDPGPPRCLRAPRVHAVTFDFPPLVRLR